MASTDTTLIIKNPSRNNQHFSISFRLDGTIAELQKLLSETYDGNPAPADQTLIYGGKVLKDYNAKLRDIVSKHDAPEGPHSIHLVIKHKPSTITASPARSVDSSAAPSTSVSRAASVLNQTVSGVGRPVPPPNRSLNSASTSGAGPSGPQRSAAPAAEPSTGAALSSEADDAGAASASHLGGYQETMAAFNLGGYPYSVLRPPAPPADAAQPTASDPAAADAGAAPPQIFPAVPYMYYNPVVGCAYQAAYSAALAALAAAPQLPPQPQPSAPAGAGEDAGKGGEASGSQAGGSAAAGQDEMPAGASGDSAAAAAASGSVLPGAQYAYVPMFIPAYGQAAYPYGYPGQYPFWPPGAPAGRRTTQMPAWLHGTYAMDAAGLGTFPGAGEGGDDLGDLNAFWGALDGAAREAFQAVGREQQRRQGGRGQEAAGGQGAGAGGGREGHQAGLRQRRGRFVMGAPLAVALDPEPAGRNQMAQALAAANARRPRVFTIRISARVLLQVLVFAVVLYQHFTWRRFLALLIGGAVLFITSTWAPFRRLMRGIHAMPPHGGGPLAGAGAAAGGAGAGAGPQQPALQRRGILQEILVFVVGFITSLLPAWNFNPEDAAAFNAAQELVAAAERAGQQQEQQGAGVEGAAAADVGQPVAEAGGDGAPAAGAAGARQDGEDEGGQQAAAAGAAL